MVLSGIDPATGLRHTYSDAGKMIIQNETGIEYEEAWDIADAAFTYSESENDIPTGPEDFIEA